MEGSLPAKRARLDSFNTEDESSKSSDNKYSSISESFSGSGESTLTSDSGFNEFTPPQSIEDDATNAACSSHTYSFERNDFEGKKKGEEGTRGNNSLNADDDVDDASSVGSTASNISGLSDFSGKDWKPCAGPMSWVQQQMDKGVNPRVVLTQILGGSWEVPQGISDFMLWHVIINMLSEPPKRERLRHINTIEDVVRLIKVCKKIIVLTGAGVSVSCGIPDFRSKDGIYARLSVDFPDLPDPQAMFDINYFRRDPRPFFKFAREIYPGQFTPSLCHKFIRLIEQNNKLLRNYTQNIDTLEQEAGIKNVIQCHGSFATATCQRCSYKVDAESIKEEVFSQRIPKCPLCLGKQNGNSSPPPTDKGTRPNGDTNSVCSRSGSSRDPLINNQVMSSTSKVGCLSSGSPLPDSNLIKNSAPPSDPVMKPDIVFFGEGLPDEFHDRMAEDKDECDLLIVIGSSLKVRPVALIPSSIPAHVPQILINREPLSHLTFDVELLGDCDVIVSELCRRLNDSWKTLSTGMSLSEIQELPPRSSESSETDGANSPPTVTPEDAPHPKDESDIEALRACWAPKVKESMAARLPSGKFLFCGGHRYVFPGAEVYYDPDDEDDVDDTDSKCSSSDSDEVDDVEPLSMNNSCEDTQQIYSRRSSQALSEDVDSLLSTASCDPVNNTPDYTSEGNWSSLDNLGGGDMGHISSLGSESNCTPGRGVGDWSRLGSEEEHFELSTDGRPKEDCETLKKDVRTKDNLERPQSTQCPV